MKLNPLHTAEWLSRMVMDTGTYPDVRRMTGRSTALALKAIAKAIENPYRDIYLEDHPTDRPHTHHQKRWFAELVSDTAKKLGLEHMHVDPLNYTLTFKRK